MTNGPGAYLEQTILAANPLDLIRMLYSGAMVEVRDARTHLAAGNIRERSKAISKICGILGELTGSLDLTQGGAIAVNLARLYDYMQHRLIEANFKQIDEPLAEVLGLLTTLSEAWQTVPRPQPQHAPPAGPWAAPVTPDRINYAL